MAEESAARVTYGGAAYGGSRIGRGARPTGLAVPGFDSQFYWVGSRSTGAYGQVAYGGRGSSIYPSAGVFASPDPDAGVTTVGLWWSFATSVSVVRVQPDGTREPVRDAEDLALPATSRRNLASNPVARDDLTGYATPSGSLTRLTGETILYSSTTTAVRAPTDSGGRAELRLTVDPVGLADEFYGFLVRTSATASALRLEVEWFDGASVSLGTSTYPVTDEVRTSAATGFVRGDVAVTTRPVTAATGVARYVATGLGAAGWLDVTERVRERVPAGPFFDGDDFGATWTGTPGLSFSDLAEVVYVVDAECPLDVAVVYELTSSAAPGHTARSEPVTLSSSGLRGARRALLTHPGLAATIPVWVEAEPSEITRDIQQTRFVLKGRRFPVVVSQDQRSGDQGTLTFVVEDFDERDRLLALLDDGSPLLLRTPASFGHPPSWWLSLGSAKITTPSVAAEFPLRRIEVPFTQVDRPSVATRPLAA